jgi:hypothetical protein
MEDCAEVFGLKVRMVSQNFFLTDPCFQPPNHILNSNPEPTNARLTGSFSRLDCDAILFHGNLTSNRTVSEPQTISGASKSAIVSRRRISRAFPSSTSTSAGLIRVL